MTTEKTYFDINSNDIDTLITETNYYNWLKNNKINNIIGTKTKIEYLNSLGFDLSKHKLREDYHKALKVIEDFYFRDIIVSTFEINIPNIVKEYSIKDITNITLVNRETISFDEFKPTFLSNEKICFEYIKTKNVKIELFFYK